MDGLRVKQRKFCDLYIELGNGTEAYRQAGYSVKSDGVAEAASSRLLSNVSVKKYIAERMKELESDAIAKQDEILSYLTSVMRGKQREQVLVGMGMGEQAIESIDVSAKDRIKAAELIGKRYSLWTEKIEITGDMVVNIVDDIEDLDDDEE